MVALWNSRVVKQSSDLKTSPIPLRCHWKPNCQRRSSLYVTCGCFVTSYHNQPEEMTDCWCRPMQRKIKSLLMIKYIAIEFVQAWQIGLKVNTILGDVMGWWNSKRIKKRWSDSGRRLGGPLSVSVTPRMRDPDCKHRRGRGTAVIQRKYRSSEVNKSTAIATICQKCSSIIYDKTCVHSKAQTYLIGRQRWSH